MADPVDELYTLAPSEFTAARNALVKSLRAEKRRDEAEAVKSLKRPSVPAWALNQVARSSPEAVQAVIDAGAAVIAAQRRALSGVRDAGLREASQRRRDAIDDVFRLAAEVLREAGAVPQTHRMAIAATLEAASVDPEAAAQVTAGRLTTDLPAPSGFGDVAGFSLVPDAGASAGDDGSAPDGGEDADEPADADAAARAAAAEAAQAAALRAAQARRRADDLADRAADARRQAVRTEAEAQRMEERAAQVRARADEATAKADDLAGQAEEAAHKAADAQAEAEAAAASVDRT